MSQTSEPPQPLGENAVRTILQKLDSISATLRDTQMRVQRLEEERRQFIPVPEVPGPSVIPELEEKPWQMASERQALGQASDTQS